MRRFAGSWVRQQARRRLLIVTAVSGGMMGFSLGSVLAIASSFVFGAGSITYILIPVALASLAWMAWTLRSMDRGEIAAWLKGADSEEYVGQAIEYALTVPSCAVAHSVTGLTDSGDIDHLVATPAGLWVVETKTGRVPKRFFPGVLEGLARKAKAAREWAPPGTIVRACLVLDNPEGTRRRRYEAAGETIAVHSVRSLAKDLSAEVTPEPAASPELANAVWKLGKIAE